MFLPKLILLPVTVAIVLVAARLELVEAGKVRLFNETMREVDIGDVTAAHINVGQFRLIVARKTGMNLDKIRLATMKGYPLLNDYQRLSEFLLMNEDVLLLKLCDDLTKPGPIHVEFGERKFDIVADKNKTLGWLKSEALGEVNLDHYRVYFEGGELMYDEKTLNHYKLYKNANLVIFHQHDKIKVKVVLQDAKELEFELNLNARVNDLRQMINDSGIETHNHRLVHYDEIRQYNRILYDSSILFWDLVYPFHRGFVVLLIDNDSSLRVEIFIKNSKKVTARCDLLVGPSVTIGELKEIAYNYDNSIPIEEIELKLDNVVVEDDSLKLSEFKLRSVSVVVITRKIVE